MGRPRTIAAGPVTVRVGGAPPPDDLDVPAGSLVAGDLGLVTVPGFVSVYPLSDGAGLAITEAAEADRTGHLYEPDTPIAPDTLVPPGSSGTHAADPVVRQAGAWLHEQPACGGAAAR